GGHQRLRHRGDPHRHRAADERQPGVHPEAVPAGRGQRSAVRRRCGWLGWRRDGSVRRRGGRRGDRGRRRGAVMSDRPTDADAPGTAGAHDDLSGPVADAEALSDDDILEAEAVAEGDPSDDPYVGADDEVSSDDEQVFVDGTPGRSDLAAERDEYLEALQRVKAEFDNFKKRTAKERVDLATRANAQLVEKLLPVFDAFDAAVEHGASDVEPIY